MPLHSASIRLDLDAIFAWIGQNWLIFAIIGGVILLGIIVLALLPTSRIKPDPKHPTDTVAAADLALGYVQIDNADGAWNDPLASHLDDARGAREALVELWGLTSPAEWRATLDRLTTVRRRRPLWVELLRIRGDVQQRTGRTPTTKAWLEGIRAAGGSGKGEERAVVDAITFYEEQFRGIAGKDRFPKDAIVTNLDAYALNQAVAVATWGVSLGLATPEESRERIAAISAIAHAEFGSWDEYGRSLVVGRAMHWSDGVQDEQQVKRSTDAAIAFARAMNPKADGPWAALPWRR